MDKRRNEHADGGGAMNVSLKAIVIFLGVPLGIFLLFIGGTGLAKELDLRSQGKVVEATITSSRTGEQKDFQVKYEFRAPGAAKVFTNSGAEAADSWTSLSKRPSGTSVSVRYLPSDPWVNAPVDPVSDPMQSALLALGCGVLFTGVGLLFGVLEVRDFLKQRSATQDAVAAG